MTNGGRLSILLRSVALVGALFVVSLVGIASYVGLGGPAFMDRRLQAYQATGGAVQGVMPAAGGYMGQGIESGGQMVNGVSNGIESGGQMVNGISNGISNGVPNGVTKGVSNGMAAYDQGMSLFHSLPVLMLQLVFALVYYCTVVSNYPYWQGPTPMSCELQREPAPCAMTQASMSNCCLSFCCPQARAAHTFDRMGILDYWCALIAMFFCPFCTLCYGNACTDLNPKLGGQPQNPIASLACTWCCSCCLIAQDAESLDAATGARTEICGVSRAFGPPGMEGMPPMGYPGPGMQMQQPYNQW